jgi:GMP synthase-like glutamine amidotransferase
MNIHTFIHAPFEKPGYIENWAKEKCHTLFLTNLYEPFQLPELEDMDWLIIMGGPMGVYEEDKFPWLKAEKNFIKKAIENNKVILGICLGAQLIAEALGAKVFANKYKEIGWFNIKATEEAKKNALFDFFPEETVVFHWHGDTFDLPRGAVHIAESEVCKNQAFIYNQQVIGLQFHIEMTEKLLNEMLEGGNDELKNGSYIQSEDEIRRGIHYCKGTNLILHKLLDNIERTLITK